MKEKEGSSGKGVASWMEEWDDLGEKRQEIGGRLCGRERESKRGDVRKKRKRRAKIYKRKDR